MPYQVTVDASGPVRVIQNMQFQLRSLPRQIKNEFLDWQSQEMHRGHPHTKTKSYKQKRYRISTMIYPRGRKKTRLGQKHHKGRPRRRMRWSTRPILRHSLHQTFQERLTSLFGTVGWAETGMSAPDAVDAGGP